MAAQPSRARADGWRPSSYSCYQRRSSSKCTNKYVSEVTLGPFAMNYIANMIKAYNSFGKTTDIETLERKLLRGRALADVEHIEGIGLQEYYDALRRNKFPDVYYEPMEMPTPEKQVQEIDLLMSEKRRTKRALQRLQSIYLFGDDGISEKDYITERQRLTDDITKIDDRINTIENNRASQVTVSDTNFIENASYFLISQSLLEQRDVNYEKTIREIDPRILKDFFTSIIQNFCILDGRIESIRFNTGVEHRFLYKGDD